MLLKIIFRSMIIILIINISTSLESKAEVKNSLINKFCIASLKSKLNFKDKQKIGEISHFTCECFFRKYKSGSSIKISRNYCKKKATEKYDL